MARIRYVKPDFFTDEDLGKLPPLYRIAFEGLWCHADKAGRLKDRPLKLKIEILPYDDCDFEEILATLAKPKLINNHSSFITRYEINNEKYIQINKFSEHQKPHHTEKDSLIPLPLTVKKPLKPKVLIKGMEMGMEKQDEASGELKNGYLTVFESTWKEYPNKKSKQQSLKAWEKLKPDDVLVEKILAFIIKARKSKEWLKDKGQFIPMLSTFLNNKRWEDELTYELRYDEKWGE